MRVSRFLIGPGLQRAAGQIRQLRIIDSAGAARTAWRRLASVGVLAVVSVLAACSSLSLAYSNAPTLLWWWADAYFDFNRDQSPLVRGAIDKLYDIHRSQQLPTYLPWMEEVAAKAPEPMTPAQACRWYAQARELLQPTLDQAVQQAADLLPQLTDVQLRHLEQRQAKAMAKAREDYLQSDLAERHAASVERVVDRAKTVYGRLEAAQQQVVDAAVRASPFDPERWLQERQRRQRQVLQTLRRLQADKADRSQRVAVLRALVAEMDQSSDPAYRAYQQQLTQYNCAFMAQLHNATTPAQRLKARNTLRGWAADFRAQRPD